MGLDMYFEKRTYVKNWKHMSDEERHEVTVKGKEAKHIRPKRIKEIVEEIGYLRKVNSVHNWIIQNVADGVDNCQEIYLSETDMKELLTTINTVLESCELVDGIINNGYTFENGEKKMNTEKGKVVKDSSVAEELLPNTEGFFFGSTDYDEWYVNDLKEAKEILETAVSEAGSIYYRASW